MAFRVTAFGFKLTVGWYLEMLQCWFFLKKKIFIFKQIFSPMFPLTGLKNRCKIIFMRLIFLPNLAPGDRMATGQNHQIKKLHKLAVWNSWFDTGGIVFYSLQLIWPVVKSTRWADRPSLRRVFFFFGPSWSLSKQNQEVKQSCHRLELWKV